MKKDNHFDIIIIGAGAAGLNIASFMNKTNKKVLLISKTEKSIGGDCLNWGCVPSKALLHISSEIYTARNSDKFGLNVTGQTDMNKVKEYVSNSIETIRDHENKEYFEKKGMIVKIGYASFISKNEIKINDEIFQGDKIIIATGSKPRKLNIPGIEKVRYLTNENIFDLDILPKKLVIIGNGPIGIELGQAFSMLGSKVTIIAHGDQLLKNEDPEISKILEKELRNQNIEILYKTNTVSFPSEKEIEIETNGNKDILIFDEILVSIGREISFDSLDLAKAGIKTTKKGLIEINNKLRTSNKNVYVSGDAVGGLQFTHMTELHAGIILNNFFSPLKKKLDLNNFGWVTFTNPQIASFGRNKIQLEKEDLDFETIDYDFRNNDRAITDSFRNGKLKIYTSKNKILGGTIISPEAGEISHELMIAMTNNISLSKIMNTVYPYPIKSRVNKDAIGGFMSKKLNEKNIKILNILYKIFS